MELKISTAKFQEMVSRAGKGASNNKLIPITSLMLVELKNNVLQLVTNDATNYLYIKEDKVAGEDFYAVVPVDTFAKLISKMTCDSIELKIRNNTQILEIKGNGNYKIELPLDEDGQTIKYPNPVATFADGSATEQVINRTTVKVILDTIEPSLATTLENPCYTGYYAGDSVVATDTYKIASLNVKLFDSPKLISAELMNLLSVMTTERIVALVRDNNVLFKTPDCVVYGTFMEGIDEYAIDAITDLVDTEFTSSCTIPKNALIQMLERLSLFVGAYDKNGVYLTFTNDGVQVSSKASNGVEIISYVNSDNFTPFTCEVDIAMMMQEVKAIQSDVIHLYYGADNAIKFEDGNIKIIVALMEEDYEE